LDLVVWLLLALAFACCAVSIVKVPNDEWDLPRSARAGRGAVDDPLA
jgi:hypothetical protein